MASRFHPLHIIFDLDGVLLDTLPFFNVICAVMINEAIQTMTGDKDREFTSFDEIYNSPDIIGKRFPAKLDHVLNLRDLGGWLDSEHPTAQTSYRTMQNIADELINQQAERVQARPQGAFILAALQDRGLLHPQTGQAYIAPYEGVIEGLQALQDAGALMGVATNNPQPRAESLLAASGLAHFFNDVTGVSKKLRDKAPDVPDIYLAQYAKMMGIADWRTLRGEDLSHVTCIEDSVSGASAVIAAGMTLVGICHDGDKFAHEAGLLQRCGARAVLPDFLSLTDYLLGSPAMQDAPVLRPYPERR